MSAGYGRGHYGDEQLARPPAGKSRGWFKIAAIVGLGAAIYWWVLPAIGPKTPYTYTPTAPLPPPPVNDSALDQLARAHGFTSTKAYEDAVVTNARELRSSGAKVELSPALQHLTSRVES